VLRQWVGLRRQTSDTATHCNTQQHTATHCNTLRHTATHCNALQRTATHCSTLQHTTTHYNTLQHTATHCNKLQHTATHCNTLQHRCVETYTAAKFRQGVSTGGASSDSGHDCHGSRLDSRSCFCVLWPLYLHAQGTHTVYRTATHCNTLQHTAAHCSTLQLCNTCLLLWLTYLHT